MKAFEKYSLSELTILLHYFCLGKELGKIMMMLSGAGMLFASNEYKPLCFILFGADFIFYIREICYINLIYQVKSEKMLKE